MIVGVPEQRPDCGKGGGGRKAMRDIVKNERTSPRMAGAASSGGAPIRRKRKRNMSLYYLLIFIFVGLALVVLSVTVFFNVTEIKYQGMTLYTPEQIAQITGVEKGDNLLKMKPALMEENIKKTLPFVQEVTVDRQFPSTLEIRIVEAEPSCMIEEDGKYYLVSTQGRILEGDDSASGLDIPVVEGFELKSITVGGSLESSDSLKAKILEEMLSDAKEIGFEKIEVIDLTDRTDIQINYDNRLSIRLGSSLDMKTKLVSVQAVIEQKLSESYEGEVIYNSATSGISVISKDSMTSAADKSSGDSDSKDSDSDTDSEDTDA